MAPSSTKIRRASSGSSSASLVSRVRFRTAAGRSATLVNQAPKKSARPKRLTEERFSRLFNVAAISANRHGSSCDYDLKVAISDVGRQASEDQKRTPGHPSAVLNVGRGTVPEAMQ